MLFQRNIEAGEQGAESFAGKAFGLLQRQQRLARTRPAVNRRPPVAPQKIEQSELPLGQADDLPLFLSDSHRQRRSQFYIPRQHVADSVQPRIAQRYVAVLDSPIIVNRLKPFPNGHHVVLINHYLQRPIGRQRYASLRHARKADPVGHGVTQLTFSDKRCHCPNMNQSICKNRIPS